LQKNGSLLKTAYAILRRKTTLLGIFLFHGTHCAMLSLKQGHSGAPERDVHTAGVMLPK